MKRPAVKFLKFAAGAGIFGILFWYGTSAVTDPDRLDLFIIALTVFGVTYGITRPFFEAVSEIVGGIMVIAEFLNRHLLEPQKQRLMEEGRKEGLQEGRARERAAIQARLEELGLDPDEILPADSKDDQS